MTPAEVAAFLRKYNVWRRGNLDDQPMPDPREIGEAIDAAVEMIDRLEEAETAWKEADKACRDLTEKVIPKLRESIDAAEKERDAVELMSLALRAKIEQMERQEPVGTLHDDGCFVWRETAPHQSNYAGWKMALYALPGAQGEEK